MVLLEAIGNRHRATQEPGDISPTPYDHTFPQTEGIQSPAKTCIANCGQSISCVIGFPYTFLSVDVNGNVMLMTPKWTDVALTAQYRRPSVRLILENGLMGMLMCGRSYRLDENELCIHQSLSTMTTDSDIHGGQIAAAAYIDSRAQLAWRRSVRDRTSSSRQINIREIIGRYRCYRSVVCPFVCLSVTFEHCAQTAKDIDAISFAYDSPVSLTNCI